VRNFASGLTAWRCSLGGAGRLFAATLVAALCVLHAGGARAQQEPPATASFAALAHTCAPHVDVTTLAALVRVESGFNPYAIGVVGAHLQYQPHNYEQALATANALAARGYDFSVGLGQVNVRNLGRVGESLTTIFDPCRNLRASSTILQRCFARSSARAGDTQGALRNALSCYYSGNFMTGYRQGYVARILASAYTNWRLAHAQGPRAAKRPPLPAAVASPVGAGGALRDVGFDTHAPVSQSAEGAAVSIGASEKVANPVHTGPNATPARRNALTTHSIAGTSACASGSSRQQVTVRCGGNRHRWCTRCLDTASLATHGGLTIVH
jgi:type IV secretion system protein VirB1